ncbi:MAG TPA: hypothetical protein VJA26_16780, partial [Gammaproteobacteria bacterium]|nr:hypothetical protein [Gammaproteobacteria bacterium]
MTTRSAPVAAGWLIAATVSVSSTVCGSALAQQSVPFNNGIPVAPELPVPPIPDHPVEYRTAEA